MKLTWFGGTTIRLYIGGQILVADPHSVPATVDRAELVSGADKVFTLIGGHRDLPGLDPSKWKPRKASRLIDESEQLPVVHVYRIGAESVLVDAVGEPQVILLGGEPLPQFGRWADGATVVLFGDAEALIDTASALIDAARPRVLALAADNAEVERAIDALRENLDGVALMSLETGMALEV